MVTTYILLGSNLGDRAAMLGTARQHISSYCGTIVTTSGIYKTAAWGNVHQPDFYNQVIEVVTALPAGSLLKNLLAIEQGMGRVRTEKWGPRVIDLDILFYGNEVIHTTELTVPHPGIPQRRFTLLPLAEIAAHYEHPILKKNVQEMLDSCTDSLPVERVTL